MKKFKVTLRKHDPFFASVEVDAENEEEATQLAQEFQDDDLEWEFDEEYSTPFDTEVISVEEVDNG